MTNDCIFCKPQGNILYQSERFYVSPAAFGTFAPGHVLVTPKFHIRCYGEMPPEHDEGYLEIMARTRDKLASSFSAPIACELGVYGQSIPHAHTHVFPVQSECYDLSGKSLLDFVPDGVEITPAQGLEDVKRVFEQEGQYITIEENGELHVLHTRGYQGDYFNMRHLFVRATGLEELANWKQMPDEFQQRNTRWVEETVRKLKEK
jgi:diadenosine tetraphosphate (Ap4A) HIT family hydrolase